MQNDDFSQSSNFDAPTGAIDIQQKNDSLPETMTRDDWRRINSDWENSGIKQNDFCAARGINYHKFAYYRTIFLREVRPTPKMLPIQVSETVSSNTISHEAFMLHLPSGTKLAIPQTYNPTGLKTLLKKSVFCRQNPMHLLHYLNEPIRRNC